jgi:hypothetical protein
MKISLEKSIQALKEKHQFQSDTESFMIMVLVDHIEQAGINTNVSNKRQIIHDAILKHYRFNLRMSETIDTILAACAGPEGGSASQSAVGESGIAQT